MQRKQEVHKKHSEVTLTCCETLLNSCRLWWMKLCWNIDCFNKADVCFAVAAKEACIFQLCFKYLAEAALRLRRRKETEDMRGEGRTEYEEFGEKQRGVRTVPEPWLRLGLQKEKGSECSLWIAVMGAGSRWTADRELQPSIDPADS